MAAAKRSKDPWQRQGQYLWLGSYLLGQERVNLLGAVGETSGHNYAYVDEHEKLHANETGSARIVVGLEHARWWRCLDVLLHEAEELAFIREHCRYQMSDDQTLAGARYSFHCDHAQFTRICNYTAEFVAPAQVPLAKAWRIYKWKPTK